MEWMNKMDIRQLEYFMACAETGSVSEAAKILYSTQPSVSKVLKSLEDSLGIRMFERLPRGIRLTPDGKKFYRHACRIVNEVKALEGMAKHGMTTWIRISLNPSSWFADQFVEAQIEVKDGKIVDVYEYGAKPVDEDYGSNWILPGFIDIHCHGAYGFDTNDAEEEGLRYWTKNIVSEGVTAFLATTITQSEEVLTNALKNVAKVVREGYEGAEILGVHLEGPYLDMKYKGAQPEQYIVKPTVEQFKKDQEAAEGRIKYSTMSTEQEDDFALTRYCA